MTTLLISARRWTCPDCPVEAVTHEAQPHSQLHQCKAHGGLAVPMVLDGTKAGITIREREDYVGTDMVQLHEGRPIMSVTVERDNGQDVAVFAASATGTGKS